MKTIHVFASRLTGSRVDIEKRIIYGVTVMTIGKAFGHASVDVKTLEQFAAIVGTEKIRGREDHPDEEPSGNTPITKKVSDLRGYFFNVRIEGEKLVADFQALSEDAAGKEATRLLFKAKEAPEIFGVSPIFFGNPEKGFARVSKVVSVDFVDIPAGDDACQQLFKGVNNMADPIKCEAREGKFYAKFEADMPKGEYEVTFPPSGDDEDEKKKAELAAVAGDSDATKKDLTQAGAKMYSAQDLEAARTDGEKKARAYSAEFDAVMDASGFKGDARDQFRTDFFELGDIKMVKRFASERVAMRAHAVGSGGTQSGAVNSGEAKIGEACAQRFAAKPSLRASWKCHTDDAKSEPYKAALAEYTKASIAAEKN